MKRAKDVKDYICQTYPISENRLEVIKVGSSIWLYVINKKIELSRYNIFKGSLSTIDDSLILKNYLLNNIQSAMIDLEYLPSEHAIDYLNKNN